MKTNISPAPITHKMRELISVVDIIPNDVVAESLRQLYREYWPVGMDQNQSSSEQSSNVSC